VIRPRYERKQTNPWVPVGWILLGGLICLGALAFIGAVFFVLSVATLLSGVGSGA